MPDEALIVQIENLLEQVIELGGQNERSQIVPNLTVQDANPTGLSNFIIVSDDRDGDNIIARKVPSVIYTNGDLVNVIFPKGTEAVAFQQGSGSSSGSIWSLVTGTTTDIYYNKGDVGIGKSVAPDARLESLDTAQPQLRLTFQEDTKFADFTLDTNHDLLIKTSSTGGFRYQPTTDQTDSFQILDADGGTPIFNADTVNERISINVATPLHRFHVNDNSFTQQTAYFSKNIASTSFTATFSTIYLANEDATNNNYARFNFGDGSNSAASSIGCQITDHANNYGELVFWTRGAGGFAERVRIDDSGQVGIGAIPQGQFHAYDAISGFLLWEYDGLNATVRSIIPNGTGDCLYRLHAAYVLRDSAAAVASGTTDVSNGASVNLTVGGNTVRLRVNADGSIDIARTAGTDTIKVALTLRWL